MADEQENPPGDKLVIRKLEYFPDNTPEHTMYLIPDRDLVYGLVIGVSNNAADTILRTPSFGDIDDMIDAKLNAKLNKVTFDTVTGHMPNVGDFYNVNLDDIIQIRYEKTTNGGYGGYKVDLRSLQGDRPISFRRDTIFDNTSSEGVNIDNYMLTSTPYVSDSLVYGSMREYTRKVIVDLTTLVSWTIEVWGFGKEHIRFVIQRHAAS